MPILGRIVTVAAVIVVNIFITIAMVISPDAQVMAIVNTYKLFSLGVAVFALALAIWRGWWRLLVIVVLLQIVGFFLFAYLLNQM